MREIIETALRLDRLASSIYERMAKATRDSRLAATFETLSRDEIEHVEWWLALLAAYDSGRPALVVDNEASALANVRRIEDEVLGMLPASYDGLSNDRLLDIAAHLEFFMLDPVFGELLEMSEIGHPTRHSDEYSRHIGRLIAAVESHYSRDGLSHFLASVLRRTWRDRSRFAWAATRDSLTGLYNRRGLFGHLHQLTAWSERYSRPLSVVLIDVDRLKSINDDHGHLAGDAALCLVAEALAQSVRESDMIGRYGGDEFAIIAPETDAVALRALMQRTVEGVRERTVETAEGERLTLSVSVGGSYVPGGVAVTLDQMLSAADTAMYQAKESGRDRAAEPVDATETAGALTPATE